MTKLTSKRAREIRKLRKNYPNKIKIEEVLKLWENVMNTPRLAKIVAQINGDGSLQLDKDRSIVSFNSNNFYEIENISNEFRKLFNIKGLIYKNYVRSKNKICFLGKKICLFLLTNGVVKGNKTNQAFLVPDWIINGNLDIKKAYLQGFYDTEGSIFPTKMKNGKIRWRINLIQAKNEIFKNEGIQYMEQIKSLLKSFDINSSPVKIDKGK